LVKLNQFDPGDTEQKCIDTQTTHWQQGLVAGLTVMALHDFAGEHVALVKWAPNTQYPIRSAQTLGRGGDFCFVGNVS
jgi:hypothetical protein